MGDVEIRPLRHGDVADLIHLARVAFADEFVVQGLTSEGFARQLRLMTRGRLLPLKLLMALSGVKWEVLVAERGGRVVGCGMYAGRKHMLLSTLMVDPEHRRQGIGQALLVRRLQRMRERGFKAATVMALSTNHPSLGNLAKQQFEVIERNTLYEQPVPPATLTSWDVALVGRPLEPRDLVAFERLDAQTTPPLLLEFRDPQRSLYFHKPWDRAVELLSGTRSWQRVFEREGQVVGFLAAERNLAQRKGLIMPPVVADEHVHLLPQMLHEAMVWLERMGAESAQLMLFESRRALLERVESEGWARVLTWMELVKRLD